MTKEEKIAHWADLSNYDLETANAMLQTKRYLYVAFMCHQAVEKIFKACYAKNKEETPPFSHDLEYLAIKADIYGQLSDEQIDFILELNPYNIETRYPEYKQELLDRLSPSKCNELIDNAIKLLQWTKETIL